MQLYVRYNIEKIENKTFEILINLSKVNFKTREITYLYFQNVHNFLVSLYSYCYHLKKYQRLTIYDYCIFALCKLHFNIHRHYIRPYYLQSYKKTTI